MDYRILGPLEVLHNGRVVPLGGSRQRALLALLLIRANQVVSVDRLIDDLWGEEPPESAANVLQTYVSRLRRALEEASGTAGSGLLATRRPGYLLNVASGELDVERFERLAAQGREALERTDPAAAARKLRDALALWRGQPLADFAFESFAQSEIERLQRLRESAVEDRVEADLALGRGPELVGELESLVGEFPLRERLRGQLMLALYRAGRQAEALQVYQEARHTLANELGIDPGPDLQRLEKAILNQDSSLLPATVASPAEPAALPEDLPLADRSILIVPRDPSRLDALVAIAEPLVGSKPPHDLLLARLLGPWEMSAGPAPPSDLAGAVRDLNRRRADLMGRRVPSRVVAFTSEDPRGDVPRLVSEYPVELLLVDGSPELFRVDHPEDPLLSVLVGIGCDVAVLLGPENGSTGGAGLPVLAPFGGGEHDWAALQMAAWLARARGVPLQLVGSTADLHAGRRDASRLLGHASLIVQQGTGVSGEPILVEPGEGVLQATRNAGLIVMGLSDRWREEGLGPLRAEIARTATVPTLVLRRGKRSGAPPGREDLTRYSWSRAGGG